MPCDFYLASKTIQVGTTSGRSITLQSMGELTGFARYDAPDWAVSAPERWPRECFAPLVLETIAVFGFVLQNGLQLVVVVQSALRLDLIRAGFRGRVPERRFVERGGESAQRLSIFSCARPRELRLTAAAHQPIH
jgi:hypothetical protein